MKVVVNRCYGWFGLSAKAWKRFAELKGKPIYFFGLNRGMMTYTSPDTKEKYRPLTDEEAEKEFVLLMYTVPNPEDYKLNTPDEGGLYKDANERAKQISIDIETRHDPDLVKVVEELGDVANGEYADLEVVEIPDGTNYRIDEYDGNETIAEGRTW